MPDRPDNQATTAGGDAPRVPPRLADATRTIGQHLDTDALSAFIDDRLGGDLNGDASGHIAVCPDCRNELAELRATVTLLRGLPEYRPRRSFSLGPEYAHPIRTSRIARLLPMLPVLRSATVAVLLLLVSVGAADILTQVGDDADDSSQPAAMSTDDVGDNGLRQAEGELAAAMPPESESAPVGDGTGGGGDLSESDGEFLATDADAAARSAGGDAAADERIVAEEPISAAVPRESQPESAAASEASSASDSVVAGDVAESASEVDAASADEAPEDVALSEAPAAANDADSGAAVASTAPAPTVSIATESVDPPTEPAMARAESNGETAGRAGAAADAGLSNWRLIEIILALVLVALIVLLFGLHRLDARVRRIGVIR